MKNILIIVSGVSGSGKSSIVSEIISMGIGRRIITCTTRSPRKNNGKDEMDGLDYFFLTNEEFEKQKDAGEFAEHAGVYGKSYGTRKRDIEESLSVESVSFAIVDTQGAASLKTLYPNAISVFIKVPKKNIEQRLLGRGDSVEYIKRRVAMYDTKQNATPNFDFIILNKENKLSLATQELIEIINKHA